VGSFVQLTAGDPAPWFKQRSLSNPHYAFDTAAGRYLLLCFFGSAAHPAAMAALAAARRRADLFDDRFAAFFGVTLDPADEKRLQERYPGYRFFLDLDGRVSRLYGALPSDAAPPFASMRPQWVLLGPTLRVIQRMPMSEDGRACTAEILALLQALPPPAQHAGFEAPAPILCLPDVFEPDFCAALMGAYETHGGERSGFMREIDGKTRVQHDPNHKRRRDHLLTDPALIAGARERVLRRIVPEIAKVHQFRVTRMERFLVACYAAEEQGHFRAHRDNTTNGTAHRRFAVSVNLNADFEGGDLSFPEYGPRQYRPGPGAAVVFSCSLLHQVSPVTRGRRLAFLPFLYDEDAARIREANNPHLGEEVGRYVA